MELTQQDFKSATSAVASKAMRNELNALIEGIEDPNAKRAFEAEMSSFYHLFNRFLAEKAKGVKLDWDKIQPPAAEQVTPYASLPQASDPSVLSLSLIHI